MDIRYLKLRLQTFRREYFDITSEWLNKSWSWIWQFTIDNFKFLYRGEIHQINYLSSIVKQQNDTIEGLHSGNGGMADSDGKFDNLYDTNFEKVLLKTVKILLIPISFIIYWIRRTLRIIRRQSFSVTVSDSTPTEDMALSSSYKGTGRILFLTLPGSRRYPRGLVILEYTLSVKQGAPSPVLYIDPGTGYSENFTIPLPVNRDQNRLEMLLELPPHCKALKLKISDNAIDYQLDDIVITESGFLPAAWYLRTRYLYGINEILHALFIRKLPGVRRPQSYKSSYPEWQQCYSRLESEDKEAIRRHILAFASSPKISIILNISDLDPAFLRACMQSVSNQLYDRWEVLIIGEVQPDAHLTSVLNQFENQEGHFRLVIDDSTAKLSASVKDALKLASGKFTVFLESRDLLSHHALYLLAASINDNPAGKLFYSDYDHVDHHGVMLDSVFKPDWNYDFFLGKNYIQYLGCYQTALLQEIAAAGESSPLPCPGELNLLAIERLSPAGIIHIPYVLLHHRLRNNALKDDQDKLLHSTDALNRHFQRTGQAATACQTDYGHRIQRAVPDPHPLISLVVLTRDRVALLSNCIQGLLEKTDYKNIEIIIVDNGSSEPATLTYLDTINKNDKVTVIRHDVPFNFSELNNLAVRHANGNYIGLVNNDISVIEPGWLEEMMGHLAREDVGVVGAKLLYEDNTVQHAGVTIGLGGVAGHSFRYLPQHYPGYDDRLVLCYEVSCVTAACLLTRKSLYEEAGGLNETNLPVAFNDVDYCLKIRSKGYKIIWTPFAELYHLESASRDSDLSRENIHRWNAEFTYMRETWDGILDRDPFYNPNLTIIDEDFSLAIPPRLNHPWTRFTYLETRQEVGDKVQV